MESDTFDTLRYAPYSCQIWQRRENLTTMQQSLKKLISTYFCDVEDTSDQCRFRTKETKLSQGKRGKRKSVKCSTYKLTLSEHWSNFLLHITEHINKLIGIVGEP